MATLPEQIVELLGNSPGLSDREITNRLRGRADPQQPINIAALTLEKRGVVLRQKRGDTDRMNLRNTFNLSKHWSLEVFIFYAIEILLNFDEIALF